MGQVRTVEVHRVLAQNSELFDEYERKSQAKETDRASGIHGAGVVVRSSK